MNRNLALLFCSVLLMLPGIYMIYHGTSKNIISPAITGVGFIDIVIALF